ncbi:MAG: hypothetical protein U5R06_06715 [candidate division KSB1 bacterium]|nr:hypothetical protein [candidate division KSB1 bacterium]
MPDKDKTGTLIQFAVKAGKAAIGRSACEKLRSKNKLYLIILAKDASERLLEFSPGVSTHYYSTRSDLGKLVGREQVSIIGISDHQFVQAITKSMNQAN